MNDFYVYGWFYNDTGQCFYIGKGKGNRYKETKGRSALFNEMKDLYSVTSKILLSGLTEIESIEFEKRAISYLQCFRYPLINHKYGEPTEAQRKGIAIAKENGKFKGRKEIAIDEKLFDEQMKRYLNREINKVELAKIFDVSRPTLDKLIKEYEAC